MTDNKQEKLAKHLLAILLEAWCEKDEAKRIAFNCYHCEFQTEDGHCLIKAFMKYDHHTESSLSQDNRRYAEVEDEQRRSD